MDQQNGSDQTNKERRAAHDLPGLLIGGAVKHHEVIEEVSEMCNHNPSINRF
jgi:hypothetical protein